MKAMELTPCLDSNIQVKLTSKLRLGYEMTNSMNRHSFMNVSTLLVHLGP